MREAMAHLGAHLKAAQSKRPGWAVGLWGEAGVGKTFVVHAILQGSPIKSLSLHSTISEKNLAQQLPHPPKLPLWAEHIFERLIQDQAVAAQSLVDAVVATLSTLAPFVLHLEDAHEANEERLELIQNLAKAISRTRGVGLLITSRSEPPKPFKEYRLGPLSRTESDELLLAQTAKPLPDEGLAYTFERARGNPLFTLEFFRYLTRQGFFWSDGKNWHWRAPPGGFVPVSVEAIIAQLLLELSAPARAVLEARAVLPEGEFFESLWARLSEAEPGAFKTALAELQHAGILHGQHFSHPLFREVVVAELGASRHQALARQTIELLQDSHPEQAVGFMAVAGLSAEQALGLLERAIARSRERDQPQQTAYLLGLAANHQQGQARVRLALEAAGLHGPTSDERKHLLQLVLEQEPDNLEVRHSLALLCGLRGQEAEVRALLAELPTAQQHQPRWAEPLFYAQSIRGDSVGALQTWQAHPQLAQLPRPLSHAASNYINSGDFATAEALLAQGLGLPDLPSIARASYTGMLAFIRSEQGRLEEAGELHQQRIQMAKNEGIYQQAVAHYEQALNFTRMNQLPQAIADLERAIAFYERAGNIQYAANARTELANVLVHQTAFEAAQALLYEAHTTLTRLEPSHSLVINQWSLALLYLKWQPPHGAALALMYARQAMQQAQALDNPRLRFYALVAAARVQAWAGSAKESLALANQALGMLKPKSTKEEEWHARYALAQALEAERQPEATLEQWQLALDHSPTPGSRTEVLLEMARLQQDGQAAQELLGKLEAQEPNLLALRARRYFPPAEPSITIVVPARLRLKVLGGVGLLRSGEPMIYKGKRRLEMLCYLLEARIAGKSTVDLLELCDVFYAGVPEEEAKRNVKQQMYLIRTGLGQDSIQSTPGGYGLGNVASDAEDFLKTSDTQLWRGPYFDKLGEGWLGGVRDALLQSLSRQTEALLTNHPEESLRLALILLQMEPYNSSFLQLALQASQLAQPDQATVHLYREAKERFGEVGETLPERLEDFMQTELRLD